MFLISIKVWRKYLNARKLIVLVPTKHHCCLSCSSLTNVFPGSAEVEGVWSCPARGRVEPERGAAAARVRRGSAGVPAGRGARAVPAARSRGRRRRPARAHCSVLATRL